MLGELLSEVPQHIQTPIDIRRIACEEDFACESGILLAILASRNSMETDDDTKIRLRGPLHGLSEVTHQHTAHSLRDRPPSIPPGYGQC